MNKDSNIIFPFLSLISISFFIGSFFFYRKNKNQLLNNKKKNHLNEEKANLTIFTFNDNYELESYDGIGGLAEFGTLLKKQRELCNNPYITTMNGDFMVATSLSTITKGHHMIDILNCLEVDFVVPGNHEFDFGPEETKKRITESKFTWLATNVLDSDGKIFSGCYATKILELDGFKIGLFGICTHETIFLSYPGNTIFTSVEETAQNTINQLKNQGCDIIIAITHQAIIEDINMAKKVDGVDLIIGGHDHSPMAILEGETLILKSGQNSEYLGRIDLSFVRIENKVKIRPTWSMIINSGYAKDPIIENKIRLYMSTFETLKSKVIAVTETLLDSRTFNVRSSETTMGNFVTDCIKEAFQSDVVIIQGGSIRGDSLYPPGTKITYYDIVHEFPFTNVITLYTIKGFYLKKALEEGIRNLPYRSGSFPQVSGLKMMIDINKEVGERIQYLEIGGKPLDPEKIYSIVSSEFIRKGGDGYKSLTNGQVIHHPLNGTHVNTIVQKYLEEKKIISPKIEGRIVFISS